MQCIYFLQFSRPAAARGCKGEGGGGEGEEVGGAYSFHEHTAYNILNFTPLKAHNAIWLVSLWSLLPRHSSEKAM